ncbi:hypothetical protein GE253_05835 [Niveispirillum sp. SYP-B3756]|nr:hypothetical protein [Niveispirillum sp. SYP-B3756]
MPASSFKIDEDHLSLLLEPFDDGPDDAGFNPFEEDRFQEVVEETRRLFSEGPAAVRWQAWVINPAEELLRERGKDLRLAVYIALGWTHLSKEPMEGLAAGLDFLNRLLNAFPQTIHPLRQDYRLSALAFLAERAKAWLSRLEANDDRLPAFKRLMSVLGDFRKDQSEQLYEPLVPLDRYLKELGERLPQDQPPPPPPVEPAPASPPAGDAPAAKVADEGKPSPPPPPAPALASASQITNVTFEEWAIAEAAALRLAKPLDGSAYALLRAGLWTGLRHVKGAKGTISAHGTAPAAERQAVAQLLAAKSWSDLLARVESLLPQRRYWLDLNRYADLALEGLEEPLTSPARRAVRGAVAGLLIRVPDLPQMRDNNNNPLAEEETQIWCAGLTAGQPVASDPVDSVLAACRARRKTEKPRELMTSFADPPPAILRSGREQFRWKLAQAQIASEINLLPHALALSDELVADAERMGLDQWEPALALALHRLRTRCLAHGDIAKLRPEADRRMAQARSLAIIFRLDPVAALDGLG